MIAWRDARPDDADRLGALGAQTFTRTFGHLYRPEDLAAFLKEHAPDRWAGELADPGFAIRIGEVEGRAAGYAKLGPAHLPFTPDKGAIELRQLYLLPDWHGTGDADAAMGWAMDVAHERGADWLYLSVFTDNHRARRFYRRHAFEEVGPYAFHVGDHIDEDIVMRRAL